jgi:acetoacetyl-CoA synthetase
MDDILWFPTDPESTNMFKFMRFIENRYALACTDYPTLHRWSIDKPEEFWGSLCDFFNLNFNTTAIEICNDYHDMVDAQWFKGATLNFAEKLLSRHDDHLAIISTNETGERTSLSYKELRTQVAACAAGLKQAGLTVGDRVAAIMPNVPNTIIAMLATASLGAIWSSCSPDFGVQAAIDRLGQVEPKILFACDGHQYQGKKHSAAEKVVEIAKAIPSLTAVVISSIIQEDNPLFTTIAAQNWTDFLQPNSEFNYLALPFAHPLYILFSSGTTGKPKCIIHSVGGTLLQHIKELGLHCDIKPEDNLFFYTTCGWMMWNWMVSTLTLGATLTLYEGSPTYPDAHGLFQLIAKEKVTIFGTSAKFISAVEKANVHPLDYLANTSLRCILSTGSPLLPGNFDFVYQYIKKDVQLSSISGGTDIVSCFGLGNPLLPVYRGELQCIGLGMNVQVYNDGGKAVYETRGEMVCTQPFPAMPIGFWQDPDKTLYKKAYFSRFPGIWTHGDFAEITAHGGLIIYGRSDTVLNPGGVRIGTAEIYRQVERVPEVIDSVVIGQDWQDDVRIILFVKLQKDLDLDDDLIAKIKQTIKINASPRHVPAIILQVPDIPRTLSGKIVEIAVRQTVNGQVVTNLESMANPEALEFFKNKVPKQ